MSTALPKNAPLEGAGAGTFQLSGSTLKNGTVNFSGGATKLVVASGGTGTLDNVTYNGDLDLTVNSADLTVKNGLVLGGTATIGSGGGAGESTSSRLTNPATIAR